MSIETSEDAEMVLLTPSEIERFISNLNSKYGSGSKFRTVLETKNKNVDLLAKIDNNHS